MPLATTTSGARCFGTPRKRSIGQLAAVVEHGDAGAPASSERDATAGDERDVALGEGGDQRRATSPATAGPGVPNGITNEISQSSRTPRADR